MHHSFLVSLLATAVTGTAAAQSFLGNSNPNGFATAPAQTYALFAANDQSTGMELWRTDFFSGVTSRVADINPSAPGSNPRAITAFQAGFVFVANDGTHGAELWEYDGGAVTFVADINPSGSSWPDSLTVVGSTLFFSADDGVHGRELWKYDGVSTTLVRDIHPTDSSNPRELFASNNQLLFAADNGIAGRELWRSDGTPAGTTLLTDIRPGPLGSGPHGFAQLNNGVLFAADDGVHGSELWRLSGGTAALLLDVEPGLVGSAPEQLLASFPVSLLFVATTTLHGRDLWVSDGTAAGTHAIDVNAGAASSDPSDLVPGGVLDAWFVADDGTHGRELFRVAINGTGLTRMTDLVAGAGSVEPTQLVRTAGPNVFVFTDATAQSVWATDGSPSGASVFATFSSGPISLTENSSLFGSRRPFFAADDGVFGVEPWQTDGTSVTFVADIAPAGSGPSSPHLDLDTDATGSPITLRISSGPPNGLGLIAFATALTPPVFIPGLVVGPVLITPPLLVSALLLDPVGSGALAVMLPPNPPTTVLGVQAFTIDLGAPMFQLMATDSASIGTSTYMVPLFGGIVSTTGTFNDRDHRYSVTVSLPPLPTTPPLQHPPGTFVFRHAVTVDGSTQLFDVPKHSFPYNGKSVQLHYEGNTPLETIDHVELWFVDNQGNETFIWRSYC